MVDLIKIKNINHDLYGEGILFQDKRSGKLFIKVIKKIDNLNDKKNLVSYLKIRINYPHENLIKIYKYEVKKISNLCMTYYKIYILYEYLENNLMSYYKSNKSIEHEFLTHLFYQLLNGLSYFERFNIPFNKLKINNIYYEKQEYKYNFKLIDVNNLLINDEIKINLYFKKEILCNDYLLKNYLNYSNIRKDILFKNDIFSLALLILKFGIKKNLKKIINFSYKSINFKILKEYIQLFKNNYESKNKFLVIVLISIFKEECNSKLLLKKIPSYSIFLKKIYSNANIIKKDIRNFKFGDDINIYKVYKPIYRSSFQFLNKKKMNQSNQSLTKSIATNDYINLNSSFNRHNLKNNLNLYSFKKKLYFFNKNK